MEQQKQTLCYQCAIRFAALWNMAPPPCPAGTTAMVDTGYHSKFDITYHSTGPVCVSCQGVYQQLDSVVIPSIVDSVRNSPFSDSTTTSITVNVPRAMTFLWLCAAADFYADSAEGKQLGLLRPKRDAIISEEIAGFKDLFGLDVKARTGGLLSQPRPGASCGQPLFHTAGECDGILIEVVVTHEPSCLLLTEEVLPRVYSTNKADVVMTWGVLYDNIYPALVRVKKGVPAIVTTAVGHATIFLTGNYIKHLRTLSQSPWFANGQRIGTHSLQEIIANPILPFFFPTGLPKPDEIITEFTEAQPAMKKRRGFEEQFSRSGLANSRVATDPLADCQDQVFGFHCYKFHSAGREDVDVRMLGSGRPFVLEILSPHREKFTDADLAAMEKAIERSELGAEVTNLRVAGRDCVIKLARHSNEKKKTYRCVCWSSRSVAQKELDEKLNTARDLQLAQKTPLRVLHRRSLLTRERTVHSLRAERINPHWFVLDLETQAGTYVKEFVHGDLGRTVPSLATLLGGTTCDIIQLDVTGMVMECV